VASGGCWVGGRELGLGGVGMLTACSVVRKQSQAKKAMLITVLSHVLHCFFSQVSSHRFKQCEHFV
jgi:hypothetical protein